MKDCKIAATTVRGDSVSLTLENGVTIHISSNPKCLHLSFSGVVNDGQEPILTVSAFASNPTLPKLSLSNYLDISYKPRNQE
jgi:hypothetical protein